MRYLPDLLLVAGAGLLSYGAWLVFAPAGYMVGGCLMLVQGIKQARSQQ